MAEQQKIEIYTRSMNHRLYTRAKRTFETLGYSCHRLLGTTADGYLKQLLQSKADYVLNIDEDAFITDPEALVELIDYCIKEKIVNCGMPDGGVLSMRGHNPLVTNPFFNVLDVRALREKFQECEMKKYAFHREEYEQKTPFHLLHQGVPYAYDGYEPYYPFFIWISQCFKTLYLDAVEHADGYSTILLNHLGKPFLVHTWYSREYGRRSFHTERINRIMSEVPALASMPEKTHGIFQWGISFGRTCQDVFAKKVARSVRKRIERFRVRRCQD